MAPPARWSTTPYSVAAADAIERELGVSRATASILVRRGYETPEAAGRFLAAGERHDPFAFAGMRETCEEILAAVDAGSPIVVHGDYDVDGVCSTAILVRALRGLGAQPRWHIPSRADGYGLSIATVERLAAAGTELLITADCAIASPDEVDAALALGMSVIVTDHHRPGERLPACPIVHPGVSGYPFEDLCAAGVAYKLAEALYAVAGADAAPLADDMDLVALATVADVVALRGENRRLVREGLRALSRTRKPGLQALMKVASVDPAAVEEGDIGFRLSPRLNAAGRLGSADAALELLLTEDEGRAAEVADELDILNRERRDTETRIVFEAEAARAEHPEAPAYVLAGEGWHPGVIGIVASRMVERYHRPCVIIGLDGDTGRGSGRSISAFDLHAGLAACSGELRRFGGHRVAAGLEIDRARVDEFRRCFTEYAASVLSPADLVPEERVDAVVPGDATGIALAEELERLRPFGQGNPRPTLLVPAARVADVRPMGQEEQHTRFTLVSGAGRARTVAFRRAARTLPSSPDERVDAAVRLELNEWNGAVEPRLVLRALCPTEPGTVEVVHAAGTGQPPPGSRRVIDRRGSGVAGVLGDLVSSGEPVLVVCADAERRRAALELLADGGTVAATSWDDLLADPSVAQPYEQVVVLDPPATPHDVESLATLPGGGFAYTAWGPAEAEFALAIARQTLAPRDDLVVLYRALRAAGPLSGAALEAVLLTGGRGPAQAARLLQILDEIGVVELERGAAEPGVRVVESRRADLEASPTYRAGRERLAAAERWLGDAAARAA
ncbi:MAG: single-stranded-DNA-specific exonuclease [Solirubrobacteraceae bacterium]|nr:single-stranded-DNA-specific exonuclease [Solirubrobacteraceae bacterium]